MNVDEAMAKWKQLREHYCMPAFPQTMVDILAAEVERLRAELAQLRKDWCDDDEAIKQQASRVLDAAEVEGDSVYVPRMGALAEMMADELVKVRAELAEAKAENVGLEEGHDRLASELAEAKAASVVPVEVIDCHFNASPRLLEVRFICKSGADAQKVTNWLRDRMKDKTPPEA